MRRWRVEICISYWKVVSCYLRVALYCQMFSDIYGTCRVETAHLFTNMVKVSAKILFKCIAWIRRNYLEAHPLRYCTLHWFITTDRGKNKLKPIWLKWSGAQNSILDTSLSKSCNLVMSFWHIPLISNQSFTKALRIYMTYLGCTWVIVRACTTTNARTIVA